MGGLFKGVLFALNCIVLSSCGLGLYHYLWQCLRIMSEENEIELQGSQPEAQEDSSITEQPTGDPPASQDTKEKR